MELIFKDIESKAENARRNVDSSHTAHREATNSGLADSAFKAVTNSIISLMDLTSFAAKQAAEFLQVLRNAESYPNFRRDLDATDQMAINALANSELAMGQMKKAIADAERWRRARNGAGGSNA